MNIAICDDEKIWRDFVKESVCSYLSLKNVNAEIRQFTSGEELLKDTTKYDLILMDVEMPIIDGIKTAKRIRLFDSEVKIVFITCHEDVMQKAFHVNAFRFLSKTFEVENIESCMDDFFHNREEEKTVEIEISGIPTCLPVSDIMYISAIRNGTLLWCNNGSFTSNESLRKFAEKINNDLFYQCHKNTLINIAFIELIKEDFALLFGGYKVRVARRKKSELKKIYINYLLKFAR